MLLQKAELQELILMNHTIIRRLKSSLVSAILPAIILFNSCNEGALSRNEQYRLPDSLFSKEYFMLLDEAGYVHNQEYDSYIIFLKSFLDYTSKIGLTKYAGTKDKE